MHRIPLRQFSASFRENESNLSALPSSHYLSLAIQRLVEALIDELHDKVSTSCGFLYALGNTHRSITAQLHRETIDPSHDLRWQLIATELTLEIGFETSLFQQSANLVFDRLEEYSDKVARQLSLIPASFAATNLLIDNRVTPLPCSEQIANKYIIFERRPSQSLRISLVGPTQNATHLTPDLVEWTRQAARHLASVYQLLSPPLDIASPGSISNEEMMFPEGSTMYRTHLTRERSSHLISIAKEEYASRNGGRLPCEVCGFDFKTAFGERGSDFAEAHHRLPLSESCDDRESTIEDLAIVCSNCHRMLHRQPFMTVEQLRDALTRS